MSKTLLLVEDDDEDVKLALLGFRLHKFEHQIVVAANGKEALERLIGDYESSRQLPAAIITDIKMPQMDGLELLRRLQSDPRLRKIPVAVLTSSDHDTDKKEALRLGACQYLMKPSDLDDYADIVRRLRGMMESAGTIPQQIQREPASGIG